jgi:molybdopterin converting factor small subunit
VKIAVRGPLSVHLGPSPVELEADEGTTIKTLLGGFLTMHQQIRTIWSDVEQIDRDALIVCNGIDIGLTGGLETRLTDNDSIVIIPLVHGG